MKSPKKNILIIGATSGIGNISAEILTVDYNLILSAKNKDALKLLCNKLKPLQSFHVDVSKPEDILKLGNECKNIDGFVYFPGIAQVIPIHHLKAKDLQKIMSINFEGAVLCIAALLKKKKINKGASLVFISSQAVRYPFFGSTAYSSSKAALETFSKGLAKELQGKKIRSNCIAPAYVESPMLDSAKDNISEKFVEQMQKMHPDAFTSAKNIAEIIAFLLSEKSNSINGQVIQAGTFNINIPLL